MHPEWCALPLCAGVQPRTEAGNSPILSQSELKKAKKAAVSIVMDVGGMCYGKFLEFIEPFVQRSQIQLGTDLVRVKPMNSIATKQTWLKYYREILPEFVKAGDKALEQRMNVRNDNTIFWRGLATT